MATLSDFSLIQTYVTKYQKDYKLPKPEKAFLYLCLDLIFNLQEDEIEESLTDGGLDRGIDSIYIDTSLEPAKIHIFNFKYAKKYEKVKNNFPSSEIDKILNTVRQILDKDKNLKNETNPKLYGKIQYIWNLFDTQTPNFTIYLCSNLEKNLIESEQKRFEKEIGKYITFDIKYHNINDFVKLLTEKGRKKINGKIKLIDTNYFEKIDGNVRALIANVDAEELLRLVTNNEEIIPDVFNDNIRLFLKYRSRINRNIKETALLEDNYKFFYFNNGITLVCDKFSHEQMRAPIVELTNIQIVNGGQTIHALWDAYKEKKDIAKKINLLIRIYETSGEELPQNIAEYTNSQNPVKNRDIRANDYIQKKLEKELLANGYFYERKKGFYRDKPKERRLDSEKIGQILMAFYNDMPGDAKNKKRLIFEDRFDEVFNENLESENVLLAYRLYERIEKAKQSYYSKLLKTNDDEQIEKESFILYASYYLLYVMKKLALAKEIKIDISSFTKMWKLYEEARNLIRKFIEEEKNSTVVYSHGTFFKGNKLKNQIDVYFKTSSTGSSS
ncbi:MAG: AIPR family protein [Candidatus Ratteibacteria bacterium]|nr:AIPR family protein [Candidatus Ratteibacteria bacterium]